MKEKAVLPDGWVDRIFEKLALTYGRAFLNQWEGLPIEDVKADWEHELAGYVDFPEAIKFALRNLPSDRPVNVRQFRDLCRRAPAKSVPQLEAPRADPERVRTELAKIRHLLGKSVH